MITIKKRISLGFLGEDYTDSYMIFNCVSVAEFDDPKAFTGTVREETIKRFIEGKVNQDGQMVDITKDNITDLPSDVFIESFNHITGNKIDPK